LRRLTRLRLRRPLVAVVAAVGDVACVAAVVACACDSVCAAGSAAFVSFGSAPKTSTAVSIPRKKTKATMTNAGNPRPGYDGRNRGNRNDDASAKAMNVAPTTARPTLWPVESAKSSTPVLHQKPAATS